MREDAARRAVAIVGIGATLPDAPNVKTFWENLKHGVYSISDVPPERWDPRIHFNPDPKAPEKTYSKIGGWVKTFAWDPLGWHLPLPPKVVDSLDRTQKWAIACVREALDDYGYPKKPLDGARTAVILGNAMAGDKHYLTAMRVYFSEFADDLMRSPSFAGLPGEMREAILNEAHSSLDKRLPEINEDTMPGELANVIAGRIAALFDLHGPNYICDAACASAMAAMTAAIEGLDEGDFDAVLTGGIDSNMSASSFVKFCKIGALSGTGTRPYADGADGFVMGEGAAVFLLKRLEDAERDGDRIHAVIRGIGGSSDGKGKGITAPNPVGQKLALERAYRNAGVSPATVTMMEGHGTSTKVGDVVEAQSMMDVLTPFHLPKGQIALGSVKSNIGHLKGAAGAAGMLKATLCLRERQFVPSLGFTKANPNIDFENSPLRVNTDLAPWDKTVDGVRRAGVSAFGFGGTNFHAVLEEYIPGRIAGERQKASAGKTGASLGSGPASGLISTSTISNIPPLRGALVLGAENLEALTQALTAVAKAAQAGQAPEPSRPSASDLGAPIRLSIDYGDAAELAQKAAKALSALSQNNAGTWKALRPQGIFLGRGKAGKLAFLFTGQGSQYVNMLRDLRRASKVVAETFDEADRVMTPLLGEPLSELIFVDANDAGQMTRAETLLRQTAITQPAVLAVDIALFRLLGAYGIHPDLVMGHSLGEYGALVAAGSMAFGDALRAVSARGSEMTRVSVADNGAMIAVFGPLSEIEQILSTIPGYVVVANINSKKQAVIGGATDAVRKAGEAFEKAGMRVVPLPVSHAFHTAIVAPASEPLKRVLATLNLKAPATPLVSNVTGEFYPSGPAVVPEMIELLGRQIASPVQFVKGLDTLYRAGARAFVETGPKKTLASFAEEVLGESDDNLIALSTNHPKAGDVVSFNQALCALYAAGYGEQTSGRAADRIQSNRSVTEARPAQAMATPLSSLKSNSSLLSMGEERYKELGRLFAEMMERGLRIAGVSGGRDNSEAVVITGAGLGLPGGTRVFDDENVQRLLDGEQRIDSIPVKLRDTIVSRHVTRLVKSDQGGGPRFEAIENAHEVIKLAGRAGVFDLVEEFGVPQDRVPALDTTTRLAFGAGLEALRDAGIPLCMHYKTTTKGTKLPDRWMLPDSLRDDTGVIFGSAFPGYDALAGDMEHFYADHTRRERVNELRSLRGRLEGHASPEVLEEVDRRIGSLEHQLERDPYQLDRKYLFKILSMGHSQFAEYIGARGPNTQINAACASGTQAVALAQDWIRAGRCRRVVVVTSDNVTSDTLMGWIGAGFLASGAAATDELVSEAALPFDRRRHGMVLGMGAAGMVVESAEAARERALLPICEVLGTMVANSAFHGSRLDVDHIAMVMENLVAEAEKRHGINRETMAPELVFVSHETYTPARGGSAQAEVVALRRVFGKAAEQIVIANTKGFTGHAMGAGIEDVLAVKMLETGIVPPVANFKEIDPELGWLNLSRGGIYPIRYALRLGAGFGSQICMSLTRRVPAPAGAHTPVDVLGYGSRVADRGHFEAWLARLDNQAQPELEVVKRTLRIKDRLKGDKSTPKAEEKVEKAQKPLAASEAVQEKAAVPSPALSKPAPAEKSVPTPAPVPAPAPTAKSGEEQIRTRVIEIVAKQTGYPPDMLDVELDLEADLGVDTVKQAETFAAVREAYQIPRESNLKLKDFPTLTHVIRWVKEKRPDLVAIAPAPVAPIAPPAPLTPVAPSSSTSAPAASGEDEIRQKVIEIVAKQTGYPPDMLDVELDLEADLGVDTVKQAETFAAVREAYQIPRESNLKLKDFPTLAHVIRWVKEKRPDLVAIAPAPVAPVAPPAPLTPVAPSSSTSAPAASGEDEIRQKVIEIVAKQTGYPPDMLDVELDLEADLGVDTVKQAETFAAVREAYQIPRESNLKLKDFPTLAHVIRWVKEKRPDLVAIAPAPVAPPAPLTPVAPSSSASALAASGEDEIRQKVIEIVAKQTGYPPDMLDVELDLEADLGVDTVKQAETFAAVREAYQIPRESNLKLKDFPTLAHVIRWVKEKRPDLVAIAPAPVAPPAPLTPVAPSSSSATAPAASGEDEIRQKVIEIVAKQTGYPPDMLDVELDLEADLGVDTVKQAETFAAVREAYQIPRESNLKLKDFPTLAHVIRWVLEKRPELGSGGERPQAPNTPDEGKETTASRPELKLMQGDPEASARVMRRVPTAVLRPSLDACKATGVALDSQARVALMMDDGGVGKVLCTRLAALGVDVLELSPTETEALVLDRLEQWLAKGSFSGLYWLPALDPEGDWAELSLDQWRTGLQKRVKLLHRVARTLHPRLLSGTFVVSATRLGGRHGYTLEGAINPMGGAVCGFTKSLKRERTDALIKVVDFQAEASSGELAELLIAETLRDPGAVELGHADGQRWTVAALERPLLNDGAGLALSADSVVLVTGAAGSIVSAITADLAKQGGTFYLLDLAPEPNPEDPDILRYSTDREGLKHDLLERAKAKGEKVTPVMIEKQLAQLERAWSTAAARAAIHQAGGTSHYRRVDLRDGAQVSAVIDEIRARHGRLDLLLHAAGLEISHFLPDKKPEEFDLVFDVKSDGWFHLWHALKDMPLGATVGFGSIAGRFGNGGQTDYAAANDLLAKAASHARNARPTTQCVVIDWTAWGGIGMASRGSIPKMMEVAGIDMLPGAAGIPIIGRELGAGFRGEVVIAGKLGLLMQEWDSTGGLDSPALMSRPGGPISGRISAMTISQGLCVETELHPEKQAFLFDHRIDGTAVLPGVMGVEAFVEAIHLMLPDWHIQSVEDVSFLAPFKFYRGEPRQIRVIAQIQPEGRELAAHCQLLGSRTLAGQSEPQVTTHFKATVRLSREKLQSPQGSVPNSNAHSKVGKDAIYRVYFHGPAYQVLQDAWKEGPDVIGRLAEGLLPSHTPDTPPTLFAPRLIELFFQTAGIWEIGTSGRLALPAQIKRVRVFGAGEDRPSSCFARIQPQDDGSFSGRIIDIEGNVLAEVEGYRTVELGPVGEEAQSPLAQAMA